VSYARQRAIERIEYYRGQRLTAADLQTDLEYEGRQDALHVRAVHGTWGIAFGLDVALAPGGLQVSPGMAYDCAGRQVLAPAGLLVPVPGAPAPSVSLASAWWFDLVIRYARDEIFAARRQAGESCPGNRPDVTERPAWHWSFAGDAPTPLHSPPGFADDVRLGEDIPLARVRLTATGLIDMIDASVRRQVRSQAQPRLAFGRLERASVGIEGSPWAWTLDIDTHAGGFLTNKPLYFVTLEDHPFLSPDSGFATLMQQVPADELANLRGPFVSIRDPFQASFLLDLRATVPNPDPFQGQNLRMTLPVALRWMGVEMIDPCDPTTYLQLPGFNFPTAGFM